MGRSVTVACIQMSMSWDFEDNQEFFAMPYFCQEQKPEYFNLAVPHQESNLLKRFSQLAKELKVVLPISFFERVNNSYFNSIAIINADGSNLGIYRKSHIPDGPGYQEKYYFNPGDTGFKVFDTLYGRIGVAICWDQWFPEVARSLALKGAEILFYPTAIGSEPQDPSINSYAHWTRVMCGHAGANLVPVVAANRIGTETFAESQLTFYGGSFIADLKGAIVSQVGKQTEGELIDPNPLREEGVALATFDLDENRTQRASWGLFRDRRPELYKTLLTSDGSFSGSHIF